MLSEVEDEYMIEIEKRIGPLGDKRTTRARFIVRAIWALFFIGIAAALISVVLAGSLGSVVTFTLCAPLGLLLLVLAVEYVWDELSSDLTLFGLMLGKETPSQQAVVNNEMDVAEFVCLTSRMSEENIKLVLGAAADDVLAAIPTCEAERGTYSDSLWNEPVIVIAVGVRLFMTRDVVSAEMATRIRAAAALIREQEIA